MTTLALPSLVPWGPLADRVIGAQGSEFNLNDANTQHAGWFNIPKTGHVTHVGVRASSVTGTPPSHTIALVTVDASGDPTDTNYGGSTPGAGGFGTGDANPKWYWFELATHADVVQGDLVAVKVKPGATPPDAFSHIHTAVPGWTGKLCAIPTCGISNNAGADWTEYAGLPSLAIKYDNGDIYPHAYVNSSYRAIQTDTTPNEIGAKFSVPFDCKLAGIYFHWKPALAGIDLIIDVYDAASASLKQVTLPGDIQIGVPRALIFDADISLTKDLVYRIGGKNSSSSWDVYIYEMLQDDAGARYGFPDGDRWSATHRTSAGAWTDNTLIMPAVALLLREISYTAGGGGSFAFMG